MVQKETEIIGSGGTAYLTLEYERENGTTFQTRLIDVEELDPSNLNGKYRLIGQNDDNDYYIRERGDSLVISRGYRSDLLIGVPEDFVEEILRKTEEVADMRFD